MPKLKKSKNLVAESQNFWEACEKGDLEKIRKLLADGQCADLDLNFGLMKANEHKRKDVMKYLLASPEIKNHADIHHEEDYIFGVACMRGDLDFVQYLLTSPELKEHANMHANDDNGLRCALATDRLEVVKYLLHSPDLKTRPNIHAGNDDGFNCACINECWNVLQYLIFNCDIKKTEHIKDHLIENPCKYVEEMFNKRELAKKLEQNLTQDLSQSVQAGNKKPKI